MHIEIGEGYINKLKNRIFKILCEREDGNPDWSIHLDSILIEMSAFPEEERSINYYMIWYKLTAAKYLEYAYFRIAILDSLGLFSKWGK